MIFYSWHRINAVLQLTIYFSGVDVPFYANNLCRSTSECGYSYNDVGGIVAGGVCHRNNIFNEPRLLLITFQFVLLNFEIEEIVFRAFKQ